MKTIDLNCDMGEGFGVYRIGDPGLDHQIMEQITSVNIACGFHAGDAATMRAMVKLAVQHNVAIGAHPGLPDLIGFGRREMQITAQEAFDMTVYQLGALSAFAKAEGGIVRHVKPHGALYNMAARSSELAEAIVNAVYKVDAELIIYGLSGSELIRAADRIGMRSASEVFADRTYEQDGSLTPRGMAGAVIHDRAIAAEQAVRMAVAGETQTRDGVTIKLKADTICVHGDTPDALNYMKQLRSGLEQAGIVVQGLV